MSSKVEICNLAISHLGHGKTIASFTEESQEAATCRIFYDLARQSTLRSWAWPFATKFAELGLVEEDPTDEWDFSYRYPSDCLELRRILSGQRQDTRDTRTPYKLGQDTDGVLIYTDNDEAEVEYTVNATDTLRFPSDFVVAFSYRLASMIAPRVMGGDGFGIAKAMFQLFQMEVASAHASAANEEQVDPVPESEFIRARE